MYLLSGDVGDMKIEPIAYTKNQLSKVDPNETLPSTKLIRGKPKKYIAETIIGRKKINGKVFLLVKWLGFPVEEATYEPRSTLIQEIPELVQSFERALKH